MRLTSRVLLGLSDACDRAFAELEGVAQETAAYREELDRVKDAGKWVDSTIAKRATKAGITYLQWMSRERGRADVRATGGNTQ